MHSIAPSVLNLKAITLNFIELQYKIKCFNCTDFHQVYQFAVLLVFTAVLNNKEHDIQNSMIDLHAYSTAHQLYPNLIYIIYSRLLCLAIHTQQ